MGADRATGAATRRASNLFSVMLRFSVPPFVKSRCL